jgi:uncharacterized membrane protein
VRSLVPSPPDTASPAPGGGRLPIVDVARGLAVAQMIAYHFCYDLNYFSWIHVALTRDAPWIAWRTAIVTQFLFLVGVSLALRTAPAGTIVVAGARFWRRWGQIAGCACLVSLASWSLFGPRWIWFGVLHFVAVAQLLLAPAARLGRANLLLGAVALAAGTLVQIPAFGADALSWIGFSPSKPHTEDFVPLLPWLGVVLLGIGAANLGKRSQGPAARSLRAVRADTWRIPALLGRWPLTVYMLHQPLLFAALYPLNALRQYLA